MGQVPSYLLIGGGRVARHFRHYFSLLQLSFASWQRNDPIEILTEKAANATHILLLISDKAIDTFISEHLASTDAYRIHVSGSHNSELAYGAHPLMSFSNNTLYDLERYQSIPFILDHDAPEFSTLLPSLPNQHVRLHKSLKAKYHALCVLSGNFSCLLWQKLFSGFENELQLSGSIAHAYLQQYTHNLISDPQSALTGPLVRNDVETIAKNLSALDGDPFQEIYKSFVSCYQRFLKGD
jgi:predicted short-subunit dehydrogenase-like oxidoreductase (DUF2520 family)